MTTFSDSEAERDFEHCDRCGIQHEPGPLWDCKRCHARLCSEQVQTTNGRDEDPKSENYGALMPMLTHPMESSGRLPCGPVVKRMLQFGWDAMSDMQETFE